MRRSRFNVVTLDICISCAGYELGAQGAVACPAGTYEVTWQSECARAVDMLSDAGVTTVGGSQLYCGTTPDGLQCGYAASPYLCIAGQDGMVKLQSDGATTHRVCGSSPSGCECNPGYTGPGGEWCEICVAGKYKAVNGSSACSDCEAGKYSSLTGATSSTNCTRCGAGKYSAAVGATAESTCTRCGAGKYSAAVGATAESTCQACPAHSDSAAGSNAIANCHCRLGFTGPHGGPCAACAPGTYKGVNGSAECSVCAAGKYLPETGQTSESACFASPANFVCAPGSPDSTVLHMQTVPTINEPYALSVSRPLGVCVLRVRACRSVNSRLGDKVSTTEECIA